MIQRRNFTVAGLSASAIAALRGVGAARERQLFGGPPAADHFDSCARVCFDCQQECEACATHCADMVGRGETGHMIALETCLDCSDVCAAAAHFLARRGYFSELLYQACAEGCAAACVRCAKECEKFGNEDEKMSACGAQCRVCEKSCREMFTQTGSSGR